VVCAIRGAMYESPGATYAEVGVGNLHRHGSWAQPLFEVSGLCHCFEDEFAWCVEGACDEDFFVGG